MGDDSTLTITSSGQIQSGFPLQSFVEEWLHNQDVMPSSRQAYRRNIRNFIRWCIEFQVQSVTREVVVAYKAWMPLNGYSACTQSNYLGAVREFFKFLENHKNMPNPTRGLKGIKHPYGHRKDSLTVEQVKLLLGQISTNSPKGLRDFAMINLAVRTGLRGCEISRANVGDLQIMEGRTILLVQGKGHVEKDRFVVLGEDCLLPIQNYLLARGSPKSTDPLFVTTSTGCFGQRLGTSSLRKIAKFYFRSIGINSPRVTMHALRHTAISLALSSGATILETKEMARHEQVASTMIYAHTAHRIANAAELKLEDLLKNKAGGES